MPNMWMQNLAVLLLLGVMIAPALGQSSAEDTDPPANTSKPGFFSRLPSFNAKKADPKAADKNKTSGPKNDVGQSDIAKMEWDLYFCREAACDKIISIAQRTGNEKLERMAKELSQLALEIYLKRTGVTGTGPSADEKILQNHLTHSTSPIAGAGGMAAPAPALSSGPFAARKDGQ